MVIGLQITSDGQVLAGYSIIVCVRYCMVEDMQSGVLHSVSGVQMKGIVDLDVFEMDVGWWYVVCYSWWV